MAVGKPFGHILVSTVFGIYAYKSILLPSPAAFTTVGQYEIPVVVFRTAVAYIVVDEVECVFAGFPVHRAVATLALGADISVIRDTRCVCVAVSGRPPIGSPRP